jgi:hypothetical protein
MRCIKAAGRIQLRRSVARFSRGLLEKLGWPIGFAPTLTPSQSVMLLLQHDHHKAGASGRTRTDDYEFTKFALWLLRHRGIKKVSNQRKVGRILLVPKRQSIQPGNEQPANSRCRQRYEQGKTK